MKIIKFRAWHTKANEMFSAEEMGKDEMTLAVDGRGFVNVSGNSTGLSQYIVEMIPMQFTGLKDKNGKECFESDLIKDIDDVIFKIEYREDYLQVVAIKTVYPDWQPTMLKDLKPFEVIGNIYENHNLLKD